MDISATLTLDAGPFAEALSSVMDAVEALAGEAGALSSSLADTQSKLADIAAAAGEEAAKQEEAARAAGEHAEAEEKLADAAGETGAKLEQTAQGADAAKAGIGAAGLASAAASGNFQGAAGSAVQLAGDLKKLGLSMKAVAGVTAAAALIGLAVAFARLKQAAEQMELDRGFDNAKYAADRLRASISRVNDALSRETSLARELRSVEYGREDTKTQTAMARLEKERQEALRGKTGADADAVNADFDRRRNALVRDSAAAASDRNIGELTARQSENAAEIEAKTAQIAALRRQVSSARGAAADARNRIGDAGYNPLVDTDALMAESKRQDEHADALVRDIAALEASIKDLAAKNTVLGAQIAAEADKKELADAQYAAAEAALATSAVAPAVADAVAAGTGGTGAGETFEREAKISSDRLARIGGFVGGASPMKKSETLLEKANAQRAELIQAVKNSGGASFA